MKWTTVLLALPMLVFGGCNFFTDWWDNQTPTDKYEGARLLYLGAETAFNQLDEDVKENVKPYLVAVKAALDDVKETIDAGGEIDVGALLSAFNDALEAFNEALTDAG